MMFGLAITSGDYNADGFSDVAISSPFYGYSSTNTPGFVYVYAGNAELDDPSPISDNTLIPQPGKLSLYPNPLHNAEKLNVRFQADVKSAKPAIFTIYNIKGQKVTSFVLTPEQAKNGNGSVNLNQLTSGVYVCTMQNGNQILRSKLSVVR
jgi:hypothetical protein